MVRDLIVLTATIAAGFFVAVAFYESLSTRDVLVGGTTRLVQRITRGRFVAGVVYGLVVLGLIPILVALWAIVLEVALGIVVAPDRVRVAESAVAIVAAARVLAYVREKTSHELAKAIPLALALSVLISGLSQLEENLRLLADDPLQTDLTVEMIAVLVALEIGLRLTNDATRAAIRARSKRRRRRAVRESVDGGETPP